MSEKKEIKNGLLIDEKRTKRWYKNNLLHRDNDLPAIEYANGNRVWYINGKRHRENDLPAVENISGYKAWFQNGEKHRENGPALEWGADMEMLSKEWYINGEELSEEQFNHYVEMKRLNEQLHQDLKVNNHSKIKPSKL